MRSIRGSDGEQFVALVITPADFQNAALLAFLQAHLDDMAPTAPPESRHALDAAGLQKPGIRMWVASEEQNLVGTVALARISVWHEELKSMRTDPRRRGLGVASTLLTHASMTRRVGECAEFHWRPEAWNFSPPRGISTVNTGSLRVAPSAAMPKTRTAPS